MKAHYFAGYCNPVKSFLPGVCKFESVEANHRLSLGEKASFGFHPYHSRAERRENPVALDMVSAMNLITQGKPVYALVVYGTEEVDWAMAGEVEEVTRRGIEVVDQRSSYEVTPRRYVIVSPGGFPSDENMYMAQRGLDLVKRAVRPGGEILLLAECRKKFAPSPQTEEYFYRRLCWPLPKIFAEIENNYKLAMQKAYKIAKIIEKTEKLWLYSNLRKEEVEAMHLYPTSSPQQVVDGWLRENPSEKILAFDQASNLAIYPAGKPKDKGVRVTFH
jgi:nickel-dependent lactate racemase